MLVVETIARIRREHFIKGKTIKEIARDLRVSRNTVRKVLRSGETSLTITSKPANAQTWAMPLPICPAPMMPTFLIAIVIATR